MRKVKIEYPPGSGKTRDGFVMDVASSKEPWCEYELEDGSFLRSKAILLECIRVDGEYDPEGNPTYMMKANGVMNVTAPDALKRKK
jgi:hypothetical protein